ncbi:S-adenosyl-L-methionine-dependent methyltransferase [Pyronema domesticum]|nr:S-adenosyl-L-methionine-dependent methyltransferase [Pyronema domesticum]
MIEVDPSVLAEPENEDYASSGYDTSTASLSSSINEYVFENGRRYHSYYGTEKYLMPTDEKEQDRLDIQHEVYRLVWNDKLHGAPLTKPHRVLDIGTGTGIWAIEMAEQYPIAEIIGTDLSPIQPCWVPPNCRFEIDDAMQKWTFKDESFDFIHARTISSGVSDWEHLISEMKRCTAPGGYVFTEYLRDAMRKMGRTCPDAEFLKNLSETAGFEGVTVSQVKEPVGPWPKDSRLKRAGAMNLLNGETAFESYGMALFTRILGMDVDKARKICEKGLLDARNKNYHVYDTSIRVYGKKPM